MDNKGEVVAQTPLGLNGWKCWERMGWGELGVGGGGGRFLWEGDWESIDCVEKNVDCV